MTKKLDECILSSLSQVKTTLQNLPCQEEIMAGWPADEEPLLSIACITYNHSQYIEDALAGFLVQKTNFRFEIVVHDDASPDGTVDILRQYQKEYPSLIRLIVQKENQYAKCKTPFFHLYPKLRGKYIALCEGDDYWVDPLKLQKQVEYLEKNPNFVISGHDACIIDEIGEVVQDSKLPDVHKRDYSARDLQEGNALILTLSWVFRRVLADDEAQAERSVVVNGDRFLISLLGQYGDAHYHDDISPAFYRAHEGGVWSSLDTKSRDKTHITTFIRISNYYQRIGQLELADVWWKRADRVFITRYLSTAKLLKESLTRLSFLRRIRSLLGRVKSHLIRSHE